MLSSLFKQRLPLPAGLPWPRLLKGPSCHSSGSDSSSERLAPSDIGVWVSPARVEAVRGGGARGAQAGKHLTLACGFGSRSWGHEIEPRVGVHAQRPSPSAPHPPQRRGERGFGHCICGAWKSSEHVVSAQETRRQRRFQEGFQGRRRIHPGPTSPPLKFYCFQKCMDLKDSYGLSLPSWKLGTCEGATGSPDPAPLQARGTSLPSWGLQTLSSWFPGLGGLRTISLTRGFLEYPEAIYAMEEGTWER